MAKRPKLWWVYIDQQVRGPWPLEVIGRIPGIGEKTRVCPEDSGAWTTLGELRSALSSLPPPPPERRCPNCSRRARPGAKFCATCGTGIAEEAPAGAETAPKEGGPVSPWLWRAASLAALALVLAGAGYAWRLHKRREAAAAPTGRITVRVLQVIFSRTVRDVRGEARTPLPGKRFCLVTVSVRNSDANPAPFSRGDLRWVGPDGRQVELDSLTPFLGEELLAAPLIEPGAGIEGRVLFQVPDGADRFSLRYQDRQVTVPPALLLSDKRLRGQEDAALRLVRAKARCKLGGEGSPRPLDADTEFQPRQELGPVYHVDAEEYSFHVDLASGKLSPAPDADTLVSQNTERDCF